MDITSTISHLVEKLQGIDPEKIIIFGSQACEEASEESDLDVLVVTSDETIPKSFAEKSELFLKVSKIISDIKKQYPIDLIVHTKAMHEKFNTLDSMFAREIRTNGKIVYEKHH